MSKEAELNYLSCVFQKPEIMLEHDISSEDFTDIEYRGLFVGMEFLRDSEKLTEGDVFDFYDKQGRFLEFKDIVAEESNTKHAKSFADIIIRDSNKSELSRIGVNIQEIGKSFGNFDEKLEQALGLFDTLKREGERDTKDIKEHVTEFMSDLERRLELEGVDGLSTGFEVLDKRLQGLKGGELYILAGRPASGKSALALNIANHVAELQPVMLFSMEMPSKQVVQRSVASLGNVDINWLKEGLRSSDEGWTNATEGMRKLKESHLIIDDNGAHTVSTIKIKCKKQKNLGLVVVDYLQLMNGKGNNRTEEVGQISRGLKQLAKELDCPIIALSQLNRGVETRKDKRPMMSDLRESGSIEQDADVIQFIYRDEYYYPEDPTGRNKGVAEIITAKFRDGEVGKDLLGTNLARSQFTKLNNFTYEPYEEKTQQQGRKPFGG